MGKTIEVRLTATPTNVLVHRFRNFGEDVYRALRGDCSVSIEEIDASTSVFYLREVHFRFTRTAIAEVRKIAEKHHLPVTVEVTGLPAP